MRKSIHGIIAYSRHLYCELCKIQRHWLLLFSGCIGGESLNILEFCSELMMNRIGSKVTWVWLAQIFLMEIVGFPTFSHIDENCKIVPISIEEFRTHFFYSALSESSGYIITVSQFVEKFLHCMQRIEKFLFISFLFSCNFNL